MIARTTRIASLCALGAVALPGAGLAATPNPPTFNSTNPVSPAMSTMPKVIGTVSGDPAVSVTLYSDSICMTMIGSGLITDFTGTGVTATVPNNASTSIYGTATNVDGTSACSMTPITYIADNLAPSSAITGGPEPNSVNSARIQTLTFISGPSLAPVTGTECSIDPGVASFATCASPFTTPELIDGSWAFRVRSRDAAGNIGTPEIRPFVIDSAAAAVVAPAPTPLTRKKCKKGKRKKCRGRRRK